MLESYRRPDKMETVVKVPLPIDTTFHSGLMSCSWLAGKLRRVDAYAIGRVAFISHPIDPTRHHGVYAVLFLLDR